MNAISVIHPRDVLAEARRIPRSYIRNAILFGLFATAVELLVNLIPVMQGLRLNPRIPYLAPAFVRTQILALVLLIAIVMADRAVDRGASPRSAYALTALAGCFIGASLAYAVDLALQKALPPDVAIPWRPYQRVPLFRFLFFQLQWLLFAGTAVLLYAGRRIARQAQARLRAAELERVRQSKRALESRLQAMQARVEPQFLFNTLAHVEQLYRTDFQRGTQLMSELIAYLRTAMPLMRSTASTVAREVDLVRNYLEIVKVRVGGALRVDIDVAERSGGARMPPMMLLPLVDQAIARGLGKGREGTTIGIRVSIVGDRVRLTVADSGARLVSEVPSDGLEDIRERLFALFGDAARLEFRTRETIGTEAILEIPYESSDEGDVATPGALQSRQE